MADHFMLVAVPIRTEVERKHFLKAIGNLPEFIAEGQGNQWRIKKNRKGFWAPYTDFLGVLGMISDLIGENLQKPPTPNRPQNV